MEWAGLGSQTGLIGQSLLSSNQCADQIDNSDFKGIEQPKNSILGEFLTSSDSEDLARSTSESSSCTSPDSPLRTEPLDSLENYVPVGVLRVDSHITPKLWASVNILVAAGWIRTVTCNNEAFPDAVRIYVLPEDQGRSIVSRSSVPLHRSLKLVMSKLDTCSEAWKGNFHLSVGQPRDIEIENESLFYIFNTLESPSPDFDLVSDPWARAAMDDIMSGTADFNSQNSAGLCGLRTPLYPYQRRSAAFMIQKESQPGDSLDPRIQECKGPTAQTYYYDKEEGILTRDERRYSNPCGGVLAEPMGFGKTLICLAVILATKGHFPQVPPEKIQQLHRIRPWVGSLLDMAAASACRHSVPWKAYFDHLREQRLHYSNCIRACENFGSKYTITTTSKYSSRLTRTREVLISSATLVIVPTNLVDHWLQEIDKHTTGLRLIVLRDSSDITPSAQDLAGYDIVMYSRPRFEREGPKISSLNEIHWLRIIVDEGHNFASVGGKSNAIHLLEQLHVERRWIVSGTPSDGMYGVEVSLASQETERIKANDGERAESILQARKDGTRIRDEELKNLDKLRRIVVDFLGMQPWANSARWTKYIKPIGADGKRKVAASLRPTLQSIIVRHRAEDISKDLVLPNLHNRVVYLEPSFHDKLSANMFIFHLVVNAVTSERTDQDYMFHPKNRKHLSTLITNLRHAGFWWTGFKKDDIESALRVARRYLEENQERMTDDDLSLLCDAIDMAEKTIACPSWVAFSKFNEVGITVNQFPNDAREMWSLDDIQDERENQQPLLLGISQGREAQKFVTARLSKADPGEGIAGAGIRTKHEMKRRLKDQDSKDSPKKVNTTDHPMHKTKPRKPKGNKINHKTLAAESSLAKARLTATTSAKLSYLLDRVLEFQETEKIIIFYEHNDNAFWVAEALEMIGVEFRWYASTLKPSLKQEYLSLFIHTETVRVLLMDLRQASHGLHVASASRVFIINPIWDPNVESQAIKRAHRISQKGPVFVETLVLKETLEEKMLRRRKEMSNAEMRHAERDLLEDQTMSHIIQAERFIKISENEIDGRAYLENAPGFFNRHTLPIAEDEADQITSPTATKSTPSRVKKRKVAFDDANADDDDFPFIDSDISPGSAQRPKRRRVSEESIVTPDGLIMSSPTPRRSRPKAVRLGSVSSSSESETVLGPGFLPQLDLMNDPFLEPLPPV